MQLNHHSAGWGGADGCLPASCCGLGTGYTGHYIVLCGYDGARREFVVRDPASAVATLRVSEVREPRHARL